jgi:hypothetical protein
MTAAASANLQPEDGPQPAGEAVVVRMARMLPVTARASARDRRHGQEKKQHKQNGAESFHRTPPSIFEDQVLTRNVEADALLKVPTAPIPPHFDAKAINLAFADKKTAKGINAGKRFQGFFKKVCAVTLPRKFTPQVLF